MTHQTKHLRAECVAVAWFLASCLTLLGVSVWVFVGVCAAHVAESFYYLHQARKDPAT
jgi:hypothetical protein